MTQGKRTDERPSPELVSIVLERFGVSIDEASQGWEGEESVGWRGSSPNEERFVQRLASWRDIGDLMWSDSVALVASTTAPEVIHAIPSHDGATAVLTPEGPVMVFPFVEGTHDWHAGIARDAAELLAQIHRGIATSWDKEHARRRRRHFMGGRHDLLVDEELDNWERSAALTADLPIHGDYYGGNLLTNGGRICGVVDWFDATIASHEQEVSWAVWEFCQGDDGVDLVEEEAEAFLQEYVEAGGTAQVAKPFDPCPWIRVRLRAEARAWFRDPRSDAEASGYHEAQLVAFERLRHRRLSGR